MSSNDKYESYARSIVTKLIDRVKNRWNIVEMFYNNINTCRYLIGKDNVDLPTDILYNLRDLVFSTEKLIVFMYCGSSGYVTFDITLFDASYYHNAKPDFTYISVIGLIIQHVAGLDLRYYYYLFNTIIRDINKSCRMYVDHIKIRVGTTITEEPILAFYIDMRVGPYTVQCYVGRKKEGEFIVGITANIGDESDTITIYGIYSHGKTSSGISIDYEQIRQYIEEELGEEATDEKIDEYITGLLEVLDKIPKYIDKLLDEKMIEPYKKVGPVLLYMVI